MSGKDSEAKINVQELPLDMEGLLVPSPVQRTLTDESVENMARSIKALGLLHPILVRPIGQGAGLQYEVISGHRRLAACRKLEYQEIRVEVRDVDDNTAHAMTAAENLQREDLTPLEQAAAIKVLRNAGMTVDQVAEQIGWSPTVVAKRAALTNLSEGWLKAITGKDHACDQFTASHLAIVARMPVNMQDQLLRQHMTDVDTGDGVPSLDNLRSACEELMRDLSTAPWGEHDTGPEICASCLSRSDKEIDLFDDLPEASGKRKAGARCLDGECFERKRKLWLAAEIIRLREKYGKDLHAMVEYGEQPELPEDMPVIKNAWEWTEVKKSDPSAKPVLMVNGPHAGTLKYMKPVAVGRSGSPAEAVSAGDKQKQKREQLERRRAVAVLEAVRKMLSGVKPQTDLKPETIFSAAAVFGVDPSEIAPQKRWEVQRTMTKQSVKFLAGAVLAGVVRNWSREIGGEISNSKSYRSTPSLKFAENVCAFFGWDHQAIVRKAAADNPEPKSWSKQAKKTEKKST